MQKELYANINTNKVYMDEFPNDLDNDTELYPISEEYKVDFNSKLGGGSFGSIYRCYNIKTKKELAAKMESNNSTTPQLLHEYKVLQVLKGAKGFPNVYLFKNVGMDSVLIMDLLGPNLENIMQLTKDKKYSIKTVLMVTSQVLERLYIMHNKGFIHRDMKPENLVVGNDLNEGVIYLIDYGLSRKIIDAKGEHIRLKEGRAIKGTVRYFSINTHKGIEQSRRDDLISLCYILIYLTFGRLPWDEVKGKTKEEKYAKVLSEKEKYSPQKLSENLPDGFHMLFENIFNLEFDEKPNYFYLKGIIEKMMNKLSFWNDMQFDWVKMDMLEAPVCMMKEYKEKLKQERERENEEKAKKEEEIRNKEKEKEKEKTNEKKGNKGNYCRSKESFHINGNNETKAVKHVSKRSSTSKK